MAESTRRVDLRLTIPVAAPYPEIAAELAHKFADYAGVSKAAAADAWTAITAALAAAPAGQAEIGFLLSANDDGITVTVVAAD